MLDIVILGAGSGDMGDGISVRNVGGRIVFGGTLTLDKEYSAGR
jgi:hypothetical protein